MTEQTNDNLPLRRLARVINGGTPGPAAENWGGPVAWATPVDLGRVDGGHISSTERTISFTGLATGSTLLPAGSVLLSSRAPIGYAAVTTKPMALNQGCKGLIPLPGVDARFLRYSLQSRLDDLQSRGRGSTFLEVNASEVASTAVPSTGELRQLQIADYLDRETAEIDAFIAEQRALIQVLTERRRAVVDRWTLGAAYRQSPLKHLGILSTGLTLGATYKEPLLSYPYIRVANVQSNRLDLTTVTQISVPPRVATTCTLQFGDVLMTEGGDRDKLGRGALWRDEIPGSLHQNHIFAYRCGPTLVPEFLVYVLESSKAREYFEATANQSTNLASTNSTTVKRFKIPDLPRTEQNRLVERLDAETGSIESSISDSQLLIALATERRTSLISAAVTGQIDVTARHRPAVEQLQDELEGK